MEGGGEPSFDAKEVTERGPELGGENRPPVTDDGVGKAVVSHHHVDNYVREAWSIHGDFNRLVVHNLGQAIDNDEN